MRYAIVMNQQPDGTFNASIPSIPGLVTRGSSRDETLAAMRTALIAMLTTSEIVYLDISEEIPTLENPWLMTAGTFADDPTLEQMLQDIYLQRDGE